MMRIRSSIVGAYASLFFLGIGLHWIIAQVFPLGFITADTEAYFVVAKGSNFLNGTYFNWQRTPPFGWLLQAAVHFMQPTVFIFWIHALLYSLNTMVMLWALRPLWRSMRSAWMCALGLFVLDVTIMRVPFYSTMVISDVSYTHVLLLGLLLIIGGFFRRSQGGFRFMIAGYALGGLAAFTRDAGFAIFPVMLVFASVCAAIFLREGTRFVRVGVWYVACCALLIAPTFLWSMRNAMVVDSFKVTAAAGRTLLPSVLDFTDEGEQILPNLAQNNIFIEEMQIIRSEFPNRTPETYRWMHAAGRPNLFHLLFSFSDLADGEQYPLYAPVTIQRIFKADSVALRAAIGIIRRHPLPFLRQTLRLYLELGSPATLPGEYNTLFYLPHARPYGGITQYAQLTEMVLLFYPGKDLHSLSSQPAMEKVLHLMSPLFFHTAFSGYRVIVMAIVIHLVALFHVICFFFARTRRTRDIGFIGCMLVALVLSHHILATVVGQVWERYALPGEIPLRMSFLLACCIIVPSCRQAIRPHRLSAPE